MMMSGIAGVDRVAIVGLGLIGGSIGKGWLVEAICLVSANFLSHDIPGAS